jgi:hypothetical protein
MASATSGAESSLGPGALPELVNAERALKGLVRVTRQRKLITAAFKRATSKANTESGRVSSPEVGLARRRRLSDDLESVARRLHKLTPAFSAAVADVDAALRAVVTRSAAGGLSHEDQAEIDDLFAALTMFATEMERAPAHPPPGRARALRGIFWRRARRALRRIDGEMDEQSQQMQKIIHWGNGASTHP